MVIRLPRSQTVNAVGTCPRKISCSRGFASGHGFSPCRTSPLFSFLVPTEAAVSPLACHPDRSRRFGGGVEGPAFSTHRHALSFRPQRPPLACHPKPSGGTCILFDFALSLRALHFTTSSERNHIDKT